MRNLGQYLGEGTQRDDAGNSLDYRVEMTIEPAEGGIRMAFRHVFHDEDKSDNLQSLIFAVTAPSIFNFKTEMGTGTGYFTNDILHYRIPKAGSAVEVTLFFSSEGVRVAGSTERDQEGRYVMWDERLERA